MITFFLLCNKFSSRFYIQNKLNKKAPSSKKHTDSPNIYLNILSLFVLKQYFSESEIVYPPHAEGSLYILHKSLCICFFYLFAIFYHILLSLKVIPVDFCGYLLYLSIHDLREQNITEYIILNFFYVILKYDKIWQKIFFIHIGITPNTL